jgi:chromosome segregation ATPase
MFRISTRRFHTTSGQLFQTTRTGDKITLKKTTVKQVLKVAGQRDHDAYADLFDDAKRALEKEAQTMKSRDTLKPTKRSKLTKQLKQAHQKEPMEHLRNVSAPKAAAILTPRGDKGDQFVNELRKLHPNERVDRLETILKFVTQEIPTLSKETAKLREDIEMNISKMKQIKSQMEQAQRREKEAIEEFSRNESTAEDLKREDLEKFLKEAKTTKERDEEEHFREVRRYETIQNMNSSRTLERKNFFLPVDEALIRSVRKGPVPKLVETDDLLFPVLPQVDNNMIHEFMVLVDGKQIIINENPFGPHYRAPDLITIFKELGHEKKYWKQVTKMEKSKWKLIGMQPVDGSNVLVFERYIDKEKEAKEQRMRSLLIWGTRFGISFVVLYGLGAYYENEIYNK